MTPALDRYLGALGGRQTLRASHPTRRATDRDPLVLAATQAAAQAVVDDAFTWPELVALELIKKDDRRRRWRLLR